MIEHDSEEVFLNLDEFAELHKVDGKEIPVIIDTEGSLKLSGGFKLGVVDHEMIIYAKSESLPEKKEPGNSINLDGRQLTISKWDVDKGLSIISLSQIRGY